MSSSLHDFIPENRFKLLTFVLLTSTLGAALLIPRIELFLGITGATIGCVVCLVAPARIFLGAANGTNQTNALEGLMAQVSHFHILTPEYAFGIQLSPFDIIYAKIYLDFRTFILSTGGINILYALFRIFLKTYSNAFPP